MEAFQQRAVDEEKELSDKLNKLGAFIHSEIFRDLPEMDRQLLQEQDDCMRAYADVLRRRIGLFKPVLPIIEVIQTLRNV